MPKVTVYRCPFTKEYFETKRKYVNHLKRLRAKRSVARKRRIALRIEREAREAETDALYAELNKVRTIPELVEAVKATFPRMMAHTYGGSNAERRLVGKQFKMLEFRLFSLRFSKSISNTHACPHNGVTNWGGRTEGAPRGYPGFEGRIEYTVFEPKDFGGWFADISSTLKRFGIHTGTGGGRGDCPETGGKRYYYDVRIFLDDFPGLAEHVEELHEAHKKVIFHKKLKGERIQAPVYDSIIG